VLSETDDTTTSMSEAPKRIGGLRVKRRAVLSDDELDPRPSLRRARTQSTTASDVGSEQTRSLRAMMEIDDGTCFSCQYHYWFSDRASHLGEVSQVPSSKPPNDSDNADDVDMSEDDDPVPKPTRRKRTKKVVPVGNNGLKKRRVIKTRTKFDAQGYRGESYTALHLKK
jgi:DNA polymerase delta subunit 3